MPHGEEVRSLNLPKNGFAHQGQQRADPGNEGQAGGGAFDSHQRVDLQSQRHQQRGEEQ
jgi:hypothetical protein